MTWIPRFLLNLSGAGNCPGVPLVSVTELLETLARLVDREFQVEAAKKGLTTKYTIDTAAGPVTAPALEFLFGKFTSGSDFSYLKLRLETDAASVLRLLLEDIGVERDQPAPPATTDPFTNLPLSAADQWQMGWTTYAGIYERSQALLSEYTAALDPAKPAAASARFWPTIATYGLAYNLLVLQKVKASQLVELKNLFFSVWQPDWDSAAAAGDLFLIDLRLFEKLPIDTTNSRFTPSSVTLLRRSVSPQTWQMLPVAVRVTGAGGAGPQVFVESGPAWLYALQAARTSVTVYGIWLGHVYHWHLVTAAMFGTMEETLPGNAETSLPHPIRQLLDPQSKYLFAFDEVLLLGWSGVAPPSSVAGPFEFLRLISEFARGYFLDDPLATLERNGIQESDFTVKTPWDQYPIVQTITTVWDATARYIQVFVNETYHAGNPPSADPWLQNWMKQAAASDAGNVQGLPDAINTNDELEALLTSLLYRVTMHGSSRLLAIANPGLAFVANFPPCLQTSQIPTPDTALTPQSLFQYLPLTGTIGQMMKFYYTFAFSRPYEPFVPAYGLDSNLFFPGGLADLRNQALIQYRQQIETLIEQLSPNPTPTQPQRYQWPLSIET
ncbi:MAG: hypothetical protein AABP62_07625 [Planctomycetota bacterium]